jgi:preprotein translocase subunit SecF
MNIVGKRRYSFAASLIVIVIGLIALLTWGLQLSIDFKGGMLIEIAGTKDRAIISEIAKNNGLENVTITTSGDYLVLKAKEAPAQAHRGFVKELKEKIPEASENRFETVGPSVSKSLAMSAFYSVALASLFIIGYVSLSFKKINKPLNSWEFGVMAIIALVHDVLIVISLFAVLGKFLHLEVDSMFITAILTIIGFSVHDTIVVFDRIREKVIKQGMDNFESLVNSSIIESFPRTLSTSLTTIFALIALLLFGGETMKGFVLALLAGMIAGSYSSIFIASSLLVELNNFKARLKKA